MKNEVLTLCHQVINCEDEEKRQQLFIFESPIYFVLYIPQNTTKGGINVKNEVLTLCHQVINCEDEEKRQQLFIFESPIYFVLYIPFVVYILINVLISSLSSIGIKFLTDTSGLGFSLLNYLFLLKMVSFVHSHIKAKLVEKCAQDILISPEKLSDFSVLSLAYMAVYWGILGLIEGYRDGDWVSLEVSFLTITLYVGFTISLSDLFDNQQCPSLWHGLAMPFRRTRISFSVAVASLVFLIAVLAENLWSFLIFIYWIIISLWHGLAMPFRRTRISFSVAVASLVFLIAVLAENLWSFLIFIYWIIIMIFLVVMVLLIKNNARRLPIWANDLAIFLKDKKTLIYQFGTDSAMKHKLEAALEKMGIKIVNINIGDLSTPTYDTVIILNSLIKSEQTLSLIKDLDSILNDESVIVDPFITRRKRRCKLAAALGFPYSTITGVSLKEHLTIIEN